MDRRILKIKNEQDRALVATILFKNGYTVRETTYTPKGSKTKRKALEFMEGEKDE